jgi:gag-polypeptide of LTR copia-type
MLIGCIRSSLAESIQGQVANCVTTADLWSRLKLSYSAASNARLTDLRRQINTATKGFGSCIDYLNRMRSLSDELAFIGYPMSDGDLTSALLNGLGPEFNSFVTSVITSSRLQPFSFADLHGMLLSYESRLQGQSSISPSLPSTDHPSTFMTKSKPTNYSYPIHNNPHIFNYPLLNSTIL